MFIFMISEHFVNFTFVCAQKCSSVLMCARNGTKQRVSFAENRVHFAIYIFIYKLFQDSENGWWALCDMKCHGWREWDGYSSVVAYAINIPELCIIATLLFYHSQLKMFYKLEIAGFPCLPFFHSFILCLALISHYSLHFVAIFSVFFRLSLFGIRYLNSFTISVAKVSHSFVQRNIFFNVILNILTIFS